MERERGWVERVWMERAMTQKARMEEEGEGWLAMEAPRVRQVAVRVQRKRWMLTERAFELMVLAQGTPCGRSWPPLRLLGE